MIGIVLTLRARFCARPRDRTTAATVSTPRPLCPVVSHRVRSVYPKSTYYSYVINTSKYRKQSCKTARSLTNYLLNASSARLRSRAGNVSGDFCLFAFKAIASRLVGAGCAGAEGGLWRPGQSLWLMDSVTREPWCDSHNMSFEKGWSWEGGKYNGVTRLSL